MRRLTVLAVLAFDPPTCTYQMYVPRTRTNYGERSFSVNGPAVWNSLLVALRAPDISIDITSIESVPLHDRLLTSICGLGEVGAL